MHNVKQEAPITKHEFHFVRVDGLKLLGHLLNELVVLRDLRATLLKDLGIYLLREQFPPEAHRRECRQVLVELISQKHFLISVNILDIKRPKLLAVLNMLLH